MRGTHRYVRRLPRGSSRLVCLAVVILGLSVPAVLLPGCSKKQLAKIGTHIAADQGIITEEEKESIDRTTDAIARTFQDLTPEEEHYIGRAVAATVLSRYEVYQDQELTKYVNLVGRTVACFSTRPVTFAGYHFLILDSDEINAFACPGGLIFVTRGMIETTPDEEALAAVLAHEVAHAAKKHGLAAIKQSRLIEAVNILASEGARTFGGEELQQLAQIYDEALSDIVETLIERGYSREQEYEADSLGARSASLAGYHPEGITAFLDSMEESPKGIEGLGFFRTHPKPGDRRERLLTHGLESWEDYDLGRERRSERFQEATVRLSATSG